MYLEKINAPEDVKKLNIDEMHALAAEMRKALLFRLSKHGGHFGPNFGMVGIITAAESVNENGVQKATYQTDSRWYEDQPEQKNYFLLLNNAEYQKLDERKDPLLNQAERSFVLTDSNGTTYQVLVFAKNIF